MRKCDESLPSIAYTNDAHEFKKGLFAAEMSIDNGRFKHYLQTKSDSETIHLKLKADPEADTVMTVMVRGVSEDEKDSRAK